MGINWGWGDPLDEARCVGFAREFHNWVDVQKDAEYSEPGAPSYPTIYPDQCYYWNPASSGIAAEYDYYYGLLNSFDIGLSPAMKGTTNDYAGYKIDGNDTVDVRTTRIPVNWFWNSLALQWENDEPIADDIAALEDPSSYVEHADWFYHFLGRYGIGLLI